MDGAAFGPKLTLVLKALIISNGRLASDLRVDKSVVGRWASGRVQPSMHNLARLTTHVAERVPGFSLLDWDKDLAELSATVRPTPASTIPYLKSEVVPPAALEGSRARSADEMRRQGRAYPGVYLGFRRAFHSRDEAMIDLVVLWREGDRLLCWQWSPVFHHLGEVLILDGHLHFISEDPVRLDRLGLSILNGVLGRKAVRLDGLLMFAADDRSRRPAAVPWILVRLDDLQDKTAPPSQEQLEALSQRLVAISLAGETNALAGPDIIAAILPGGNSGAKSLSVSDTGWTPNLEGDIRRARKAVLGVDDCYPTFDV